MSPSDRRLIVFVDTSYLRRKAKTQSADWNRLLLLSRNRQVDIHVSHIAIEEYRSQCVDHLHAKIEKSRNALNGLQREWASNPVTDNLGESIDSDIFPSLDQLKNESEKVVNAMVNDNRINVIMPTDEHGKRVWSDYFSWRSIFGFAPPSNRDHRGTRDSRRKQIPDAWILESAVDLHNSNSNVVCLCVDDGLTEQLVKRGLKTVASAEVIQQMVEGDYPEKEDQEPEVEKDEKGVKPSATSILNEKLATIENEEKILHLRILGYSYFFSPVSKSALVNLLEERGHSEEQIDLAARRLVLNSLLRDTGNHYLVTDKIAGKEAATEVMEEIVEKL